MREWGERNPNEEAALIRVTSIFGILLLLAGVGSFLMEWCGYTLTDVGNLIVDNLWQGVLYIVAFVVIVVILATFGTWLLFKLHCDRD